ncbi:MAG: ATP-binding protein [Cyanobacteria bacterium P01_D01_bin.1]
MQTSQHSIDNQIFSFDAYRRLRDSLIHQEHFFETVITEAHFAAANDRSAPDHAGPGKLEEGLLVETDFVLMRSPTLSVLLTATPLRPSASPFTRATNGTTHHLPLNASYSSRRHSSHRHSPYRPHSSRRQSDLRHAPYADYETGHSDYHSKGSDHSAYKDSVHQDSAPQDIAPADSTPQDIASKASLEENMRSPQQKTKRSHQAEANRYQINLTFDHTKVEKFMAQLPFNYDGPRTSRLDRHRSEGNSLFFGSTQPTHHSQPTPKEISHSHPGHSHSDSFFLSWAKGLATAPNGDGQPAQSNILRNEIEQSLLLNQVITRIRHSLDLPSILRTTVAQVREFLSADRLVLYQFSSADQFSSTDEAIYADESALQRPVPADTTEPSQTSSAATAKDAEDITTGGQTHVAHISYEARRSEEVSSVLNFTEKNCFGTSLSNHSHYLSGQPVAVDNIDEQYAHAGCLVDFLRSAGVKSQIIAPVIVKDQLWGLLIAHQCSAYRHWQKTETVFLQHIAEHLAVAIEQASLYHQLRQQKVSLESCVVERTQNLQDALEAAASADRTKGEFLSTMSHELRTPLTYIIGMSATLLRWSFGELSDRQRSYLTTINHSGEQLLGVINDILEFAKVESGRSQLNVSGIALPELVQSVVEHHQAMANNHDVRLSLDCALSPDYADFQADYKRIEQILTNLINNAIKFTPAGGQVTLRVHEARNAILLQVEDTGIGIPESQKQFLFEKFKQLESPFRRQYSGTGLGLAMTKHLVELHGGTIQVDSTVGQGSTFVVNLPVRSKQSSAVRYQVSPALERGTKPVVLLIEAEENSAALICELLTADGYEVIWLTPAEDIAIQLSLLKPAMLIADLSLLSHRQDEVKAIEQSITAAGTRVLALLGQPAAYSSHIAHHDTLEKPVEPKKLIEKSRRLTSDKTEI